MAIASACDRSPAPAAVSPRDPVSAEAFCRPSWPAWAQWPRDVGGALVYQPTVEEWRGNALFTRSAVACSGGAEGVITLSWSLAFDGRTIALSSPTVASCAWDGEASQAASCRAALDASLPSCTWTLPLEALLSLVSTDTMPPEPTVEQADRLRAARQDAATAGVELLNDREALFMAERWPRDEVDALVIAPVAADWPAPCGTAAFGSLRLLGRDGKAHELRGGAWATKSRDGWVVPEGSAVVAVLVEPGATGSLSESRERFERTVVTRDKVFGLLDRAAYRWKEAVARAPAR